MGRTDYSEILVTGGFGYLGGRIAEHFRHQGYPVAVLGLLPQPQVIEWAEGLDIRIADVAVIHCASVNQQICESNPAQSVLVNGLGTFNMLEKARTSKAQRFIYFSTFHVYGRVAASEIDEEAIPRPVLHYGISHLLGEMFVSQARAQGLAAVSLRPTNGYGAPAHLWADSWMLALNDFCRSGVNEGRIVLATTGEQRRDFVSIRDIIRALEILLGGSPPMDAVYNVGGDNVLSIRELAQRVVEVAEKDYGRRISLEVPRESKQPAAPWKPFRCDRIKKLGYKPRDEIREAVRELFHLLGWNGK
ncbi:MAG: SDR family oxidoreductase [Deltaproteobacteria bacterium]|nr:SDR family oxidoreductase [Deltaproteobacteria bacterium]